MESTIISGGLIDGELNAILKNKAVNRPNLINEMEEDNFLPLKGFLRKKSRQEKWQKRWFEATGHYLTYYKNEESDVLLACIDLWRTGEIKIVDTKEPLMDGTVNFSIAIGEQFYVIKADSLSIAESWVEGLKQRQVKQPPATTHALVAPMMVIPPSIDQKVSSQEVVSIVVKKEDVKKEEDVNQCCGLPSSCNFM